MTHDQLILRLELDLDANVVDARNRRNREVRRRVLRKEETERDDKLLAVANDGICAVAVRDDAVVLFVVGVDELSVRRAVGLRTHKRASGAERLLVTVPMRVVAHQLVNDVQVIARKRLHVVRPDGEGDLVDHRHADVLDPAPHMPASSRSISRRHLVEFDHQVAGTEQVRGLRNDEIDGAAETRGVLRVDVAQLHLKVGGADVTDVREVGTRVVVQERILGTGVELQLGCHRGV